MGDAGIEPGGVFSEGELRALVLVAAGLTDAQIAARLGLSVHTVRHRISGLMVRGGYKSRTELVVRCLVDQILELDWPVRAKNPVRVKERSQPTVGGDV